MNIRLLEQSDWQAFKTLRMKALLEHPESFGASFNEESKLTAEASQQQFNSSDLFGAFINNELVGCAGFFIYSPEKMHHRGCIFSMYTNATFRGRGTADALVKTVIAHAKKHVLQLHLTVVTSNHTAIRLYQKNGFRIYGTEPRSLKIDDQFYDEHLMVLDFPINKPVPPSSLHITLHEPTFDDEEKFLSAMIRSQKFHAPFVSAPCTHHAYHAYIKNKNDHQKSYIAVNEHNNIMGVFNISEIVRGGFQSAYMGFYASVDYAGCGLMSKALKLVLQQVFEQLKLHRIEANIQPHNIASIQLVTRNGFQEEGYSPKYLKINDVWCDHKRFALTYESWLKNITTNL